MALTYTPQIKNETMPQFSLKTVTGENWSSKSSPQFTSRPKAKVIAFICNHCPYVKAIENRLIKLAHHLKLINVPFIGICSNDPTEYPEDSPSELLKRWQEKQYAFTYLIDETQQVAKAFGAVCTPDFFVYNNEDILIYRGRLDDSWKDETKIKREELYLAVEAILKGADHIPEQSPSMGCSIKWREK